ncbi:unnamed protein product [Parajaminaea phylloscopi]
MVEQRGPRWKRLLQSAIDEGIERGDPGTLHYSLATIGYDPASGAPVPHNRTVGHRGFLNDDRTPTRQRNTPPPARSLIQRDFGPTSTLCFTTDVRSQKALDIQGAHARGQAAHGAALWYFPSRRLQIRIEGTLHLLAHPQDPSRPRFAQDSLAPKPTQDASTARSHDDVFQWDLLRNSHFQRLDPWLLCGLLRPAPGEDHPQAAQLEAVNSWPGQAGTHAHDSLERPWKDSNSHSDFDPDELKRAERNFALVLFRPHSVDIVDLDGDRRSSAKRLPDPDPDPDHTSTGDGGAELWSEKRIVP